jgi:hypothetical protein
MSLNSGHVIIALSAVYFVFASYAILFSAFLPLTGVYVRYPVTQYRKKVAQSEPSGSGCTGTRHALQIFCHAGHTHEHLFCNCELGWLAVLPQFVTFKCTFRYFIAILGKVIVYALASTQSSFTASHLQFHSTFNDARKYSRPSAFRSRTAGNLKLVG